MVSEQGRYGCEHNEMFQADMFSLGQATDDVTWITSVSKMRVNAVRPLSGQDQTRLPTSIDNKSDEAADLAYPPYIHRTPPIFAIAKSHLFTQTLQVVGTSSCSQVSVVKESLKRLSDPDVQRKMSMSMIVIMPELGVAPYVTNFVHLNVVKQKDHSWLYGTYAQRSCLSLLITRPPLSVHGGPASYCSHTSEFVEKRHISSSLLTTGPLLPAPFNTHRSLPTPTMKEQVPQNLLGLGLVPEGLISVKVSVKLENFHNSLDNVSKLFQSEMPPNNQMSCPMVAIDVWNLLIGRMGGLIWVQLSVVDAENLHISSPPVPQAGSCPHIQRSPRQFTMLCLILAFGRVMTSDCESSCVQASADVERCQTSFVCPCSVVEALTIPPNNKIAFPLMLAI
jgi:hypothetical protein